MGNLKKVLVYGMTPICGGTESFVMNYYKNMDRDKIQFDFLVNNEIPAFYNEIISMEGKVKIVAGKRKNIIKNFIELRKFFADNQKEYEAIWCNICSLSNILPLKLAKKYDIKKRIIHSHNSRNMGGKMTYILHNINKNIIEKYATDFWACSNVAADWFFDKNIIDSSKFRIIRNSIDVFKFKFSKEVRERKREELNIESDQFVVGHIGRFHFQKNHEFLIRIFKEIHSRNENSILLLIGEGENENKIKSEVVKLGLADVVRFLGVRSDVSELMQAMDVFILPSKFEGLPIAGIEAQATGLPCIFSDAITKEVSITPNCTFLSLQNDCDVWADEILKYKSGYVRKDTTQQVIDAGFDIVSSAKQLEDFFISQAV